MTISRRGPRPGPGGMAEPCGHRRSVTLPRGPLGVAGVSGSPGSVHALRSAADLACRHGAALVPVLAWVPSCGDLAERKHPDPELRRRWKQDAWQRLRDALGTALGGSPRGMRTWPLVLRGPARPQLVSLAGRPGALLVIGAGRRTALTRLVCCPVARHCLARARCPVLAVPPPPTWPSTPAAACAAGHSVTAASTPATPACPARRPNSPIPNRQPARAQARGRPCQSGDPASPPAPGGSGPCAARQPATTAPALRPTTSPVSAPAIPQRQRRQTPPELADLHTQTQPADSPLSRAESAGEALGPDRSHAL